MANERRPSIFNDRGSIGSEKDLDEYGVWVKSEREEFPTSGRDDSFGAEFPPFDEMPSEVGGARRAPGTDAAAKNNADITLSAALLVKIAEELGAIKLELASLKSELDRVRRGGVETTAQEPAVSMPMQPEPAEAEIPADETGDNIPADTGEVEDDVVDDAVFDGFGIEEPAGETPDEEPASEDKTDFFDAGEDGGKITLTSDELDLLSESADETPEEMNDSFFSEDGDKEKIAFTGDEINDILSDTEIPGEAGNAGRFEGSADEAPIEDDVFDIDIETAGESLSEDPLSTESEDIILEDDSFEIEADNETPVPTDAVFEDSPDIEIYTEDAEPVDPIPETADITIDPFGSIPGEDGRQTIVDDGNPFAGFPATEEPPAEKEAETLAPIDEAADDAPFADLPTVEDPFAEDAPETPATDDELGTTAAIDDPFAGLSLPEDDNFGASLAAETDKIEEPVFPDEPPAEPLIAETAVPDETPETLPLPDDFSVTEEAAAVESDHALSQLMDEGIRPMSPALDDTSYLDDEKPVEFDDTAVPDLPAIPAELAASEPAPVPEETSGAPAIAPAGEESPAVKNIPQQFKQELRAVLSYMDILLESLPEEKIEEFARSEHFEPYKKLFTELGLV